MGILTNLLSLADQQAQEKRNEERDRYATIAQIPGIRPEIQSWAIDQLVGMAPKKSGIGQLGDLFKGMAGKGGGGQSPAATQSFHQALQSTGAAQKTVQSPTGVAPGPQGPITGAPGSTESLQQMERTRQPGTSPMTIGGVAPSMMLSPQEQLAIKLDETRATEKIKRDLAEQGEAGMRRIQSDADEFDTRRKEKVRSDLALKAWIARGELIKAGNPEDAANEISGWKEYSQIKGAPKLIDAADPQLQAWSARTGNKLEEGAQYWAYLDAKGDVEQALKGPPKTAKTGDEFSGTLKEDVQAQNVVTDYEAAKRTGRKSKYSEAEYKAAKDFLTKQNRPPAFVINQAETASEAKDIAEAIRDHRMPPTLTGFGRSGLAGKVARELSKMKDDKGEPFNLAKQQLDWTATQQHMRSLNGAQQLRLQEATNFSVASLNRLSNPDNPGQDLIGQLRRFVPRSKYPTLNRAAIAAAKSGILGDAAASAATQLESQVSDLQFELGTVYMGGNSPTDRGIGKARDMLAGEWSENVLRDGVDLSRANLGYRLNSITQSQPMGVGSENPYASAPPPVPEQPIVNRGAQAGLPKPPRPGAQLDATTARKYLDAFNGDKQAAFAQATKDGWKP